MSVIQTNNIFFREFILSHLKNQFNARDLYDVVASLNPSNEKYKISSDIKKYADSSYKIDMRLAYEFRTESAASLFLSTYENLIQKGSSSLKLKIVGSGVLLTFKDQMVVSYKHKHDDLTKSQKTRIEEAIAYREESSLISDVFIKTIDVLFKSGLYNEVQENKKNQKLLYTVDAFRNHEKKLQENKTIPTSVFYKLVMKKTSIKSDPKLNNLIMGQVASSMNSRVDRVNGEILTKSIFRLMNEDASIINIVQNKKNEKVRLSLKELKVVDKETINSESFIKRLVSKITGVKLTNEVEKSPDKNYNLRYK